MEVDEVKRHGSDNESILCNYHKFSIKSFIIYKVMKYRNNITTIICIFEALEGRSLVSHIPLNILKSIPYP